MTQEQITQITTYDLHQLLIKLLDELEKRYDIIHQLEKRDDIIENEAWKTYLTGHL